MTHPKINSASQSTLRNKSKFLATNVLFERLLLIASTHAYALSILYSYRVYLNPVWGYYGFKFSEPSIIEYSFGISMLTVAALALPKSLSRPSSVILLFLFAIVFVPAIVITLCLESETLTNHWAILLSLTTAFTFSSISSRTIIQRKVSPTGYPSRGLIFTFILFWAAIASMDIAIYHSIMGFASIENMYEQREAGASKNAITAYSQTLFTSVFSPTLFSLGLIYKKRAFVLMGISGSILVYSITAQKTILLLPIVIYFFFQLQSTKTSWIKTSATPLAALAALTFLSSLFSENSAIAGLFAAMLVFRTIAIPGLTYSQYHELFSQHGYTWWSHVKGLSLIIPAPTAYVRDDLWPGLGYIVGEYVYGRSDLNANANLFSGDGLAAAGWFGVILISIVFSIWIKLLDITAAKWDHRFSTLAILPLAISLTNGHLFTSLLSFGGIAWLIIFSQFKPEYRNSIPANRISR